MNAVPAASKTPSASPAGMSYGSAPPRFSAFLEALTASQEKLPRGSSVAVFGLVKRPGAILAGDGLALSKVIALAGGVTGFADRRQIGVWRPAKGRFMTFSLEALETRSPAALDPLLQGGDVVVVLERRWTF